MRKKLLAVSILIFLTIGLFSTYASSGDVPMITKEQLSAILGKPDLVILDVRLGSDYFSSDLKIKGAVRPDMFNLIWHTVNEYPRENTFVLYCASPNEERSVINGKELIGGREELGLKPCTHVYVLKGGWEEWLKASLPTEKK